MSNIDEKVKNNFTIEMRIFENYEKVKYEIIKAIERAEDYLRYLYLKRKNSRVLKVTGRIDITSRLKSVREDY